MSLGHLATWLYYWCKGARSYLQFDFQIVHIHHFVLHRTKKKEPLKADNAAYASETGVE